VRLTIGDWSQTHRFSVLPDPRWTHISPADYEAQLDMALEIRDMIDESQKRIRNLRSVREQMGKAAELATKAGHSDKLKTEAEAIGKKLTEVEALLINNNIEVTQDEINFERVFCNHLLRLYSVVMYAQDRPTGGAEERFTDLKADYAEIVKKYDAVMESELPKFNQMLEQERVNRIIVPEKF